MHVAALLCIDSEITTFVHTFEKRFKISYVRRLEFIIYFSFNTCFCFWLAISLNTEFICRLLTETESSYITNAFLLFLLLLGLP